MGPIGRKDSDNLHGVMKGQSDVCVGGVNMSVVLMLVADHGEHLSYCLIDAFDTTVSTRWSALVAALFPTRRFTTAERWQHNYTTCKQ